MCMNRPKYQESQSEPNKLELPFQMPSTKFDLEKQQSQSHDKQHCANKRNYLYKLIFLFNFISLLILGLVYYSTEVNPQISANLNELLYKMEKCNDL